MSKPKNIKNTTETGICNHHNCDHQEKEVSKCRHCGRPFCKEHIKPIIPSIDGFSNHNDWKVFQGHGCPDYSRYLEKQRKIQFKKENEALNIITGKVSKRVVTNIPDISISYQDMINEYIKEEYMEQEHTQVTHPPDKQSSKPQKIKNRPSKSEKDHDSRYRTITIDFYAIIDKIKCFLGFHKLEKYMGPDNYGNGRIRQRYICKKCRKIKEVIY
ncbi:MAG: hypothetical protein GQ477_05845 [Nanohaloarchaea archaeon]|nr:hypothetical protein [Candidatus Nanohaloarchaea archaeon]